MVLIWAKRPTPMTITPHGISAARCSASQFCRRSALARPVNRSTSPESGGKGAAAAAARRSAWRPARCSAVEKLSDPKGETITDVAPASRAAPAASASLRESSTSMAPRRPSTAGPNACATARPAANAPRASTTTTRTGSAAKRPAASSGRRSTRGAWPADATSAATSSA